MRLVAALLISFMAIGATMAQEAGLPWITSYDDALIQLKEHKKPLFIEFYADWCGPCKQMDAEVYSQAEVIEALEPYTPVKINVDTAMNVAAAYQVNSIPRFIVVSADGEIVGDQIGFVQKDYFLSLMDMIAEDVADDVGGAPMPDVRPGQSRGPEDGSIPEPAAGPTAEEQVAKAEGLDDWLALLGDVDPAVRKTAGVELAKRGGTGAWILVEGLASEYLGTRIGAYEAATANELTDLPFDPWAELADRNAALKDWRQWRDRQLSPASNPGALAQPIAEPTTPAVQ